MSAGAMVELGCGQQFWTSMGFGRLKMGGPP